MMVKHCYITYHWSCFADHHLDGRCLLYSAVPCTTCLGEVVDVLRMIVTVKGANR